MFALALTSWLLGYTSIKKNRFFIPRDAATSSHPLQYPWQVIANVGLILMVLGILT